MYLLKKIRYNPRHEIEPAPGPCYITSSWSGQVQFGLNTDGSPDLWSRFPYLIAVIMEKGLVKAKMDIKELTDRMHVFVQSKGWYENDSKRPQTPRNIAISLSLEVNEVLEHFQWGGEIMDQDELASELADVTLYLLQLASISGVDLEQAVLQKLDINASRDWDS